MRRALWGCSLVMLLVSSAVFAMDGVTVTYQEIEGDRSAWDSLPAFVIRNQTNTPVQVKASVAVPKDPRSKLSLVEYTNGGTVAAGKTGVLHILDFKNKDGGFLDPAYMMWKKNQRPKEGCVVTFHLKAGDKEDTVWISVKTLHP